MVRTVVDGYAGGVAAGVAVAAFGAAAAGVASAAGVVAAGAAAAPRLGNGNACPSGIETRPLLGVAPARVAFVITGVFAALRFARFASATSGESSAAETVAAVRSRPTMSVRMADRIAKTLGKLRTAGVLAGCRWRRPAANPRAGGGTPPETAGGTPAVH